MHRASPLLVALLTASAGCDDRDEQPVEVTPSPVAAKSTEVGPDPGALRSKPAPRELTDSERALAGTWVARVGPDAPRSAAMSDKVMLQTKPGKDLMSGVIEAVENDTRISTACIWIELYANLSGFRNECALVAGEPQALNKHDPFTGAAQPFGVALTWSVDGGMVHIVFDEPMLVPVGAAGTTREFRRTTLKLQAGAGPTHEVAQAFPDHPDIPPRTLRFEVFPGSYVDDGSPL